MSDQSSQSNDELLWQSRAIGEVVTAMANGDLKRKVPLEAPAGMSWNSEQLEVAKTLNRMVEQLNQFADEATRVSREMGTEGVFGGQMWLPDATGTWKGVIDNINLMGRNLTGQVRNMALVTTAVANGDLSKKMTVDAEGEMDELKLTINVMVDQLDSFSSQVLLMAREMGTESLLGGQIKLKGASGVWQEMTDNLNIMVQNLTVQIRAISKIVTAVANGEFNLQLVIESHGEVGPLVKTLNDMSDMLSIFASEITTVARKVGTQSELGYQAEVPNASGTWIDLINNLNFMSNTLTVQVRSL
ncbi:MAG: hypothetical protein JWN98_1758, partial [Abditibacteriota bacterium]|nr:hypothetical protein [Abditibacteriota bacterium]